MADFDDNGDDDSKSIGSTPGRGDAPPADVGMWLDEWEDMRDERSGPARTTRQLPAFNLGTPPGRVVPPQTTRKPTAPPPDRAKPPSKDGPGRESRGSWRRSSRRDDSTAPDPSRSRSVDREVPPPKHPKRVPSPPPVRSPYRPSPRILPTGIDPADRSESTPVHEVSDQIMPPAIAVRDEQSSGDGNGAATTGRGYSMGGVNISVDTESRGLVVAGMLVCCAFVALFGYLVGRGGDAEKVAAAPETTTTGVVSVPELAAASQVPNRTPAQLAAATVQLIGLDDDGQPKCAGSGFFVQRGGHILTNAHVVIPSDECRFSRVAVAVTDDISNPPDLLYSSEILAVDEVVDLAVLRVTDWLDEDRDDLLPTEFPVVSLGDSDLVELGDNLRIFGYPVIGGETITSTAGTVSGFTSQVGVGRRAVMKTDATIAAGNSGGIAVNQAGEVIGIPTRARASESGPAVDCRAIFDTNDDGEINDDDTCIPVGGYLNGIRPVNLARNILAEAAEAPRSSVEVDLSAIKISNPRFSTGVTEDNWPTDNIVTATEGVRELCLFVDWVAIPDGAAWDSIWLKDGETLPEFGIYDQLWPYGPEGLNFWLCAEDSDGLEAGVYEVGFFVDGSMVFDESFEVTTEPADIYDVVWVNQSGTDVCSLSINPLAVSRQVGVNELDPGTVLRTGQSQTLKLASGSYAVEALGCDGVAVADESDADGLLIPGDDHDGGGTVVFIIGSGAETDGE